LTIFEHKPSFNEKKAFVGMFRKKWKEDKGYCSLFDKRKSARMAKSASIDQVERRQRMMNLFRLKMEKQMEINKQSKALEES